MIYKIIATISYVVSVIFGWIGFDKILNYENPEDSYLSDPVNSYVGGDAYNFVINSNYATAYFVLSLIFVVIGCTLLIVQSIEKTRKHDINNFPTKEKTTDDNEETNILND